MRDRTADLLRAKQALSQLSYSPIGVISVPVIFPETRRGEAKHTEVCELCPAYVSRKFERLEHTLTVCRFNFQLDPDF